MLFCDFFARMVAKCYFCMMITVTILANNNRITHIMSRLKRRSRFSLFATFVFLVVVTGVSLTGCTGEERQVSDEDRRIDEAYSMMHNLTYTNPDSVIGMVDGLQASVTDSSNYYKLEMLRADALCNAGEQLRGQSGYEKVYDYCRRSGDKELELIYWNYYGNYVTLNLGLRDSARACYERAFALLSGESDMSRYVSVCINLADSYRFTGDPAGACLYYRRALAVLDSIGSDENLFNVYVGLGQIYAEIANYSESERYFNFAGEMLDSASTYDKFFYYNSYGNELYFAHRYDEALQQFNSALKYADELWHPAANCIVSTNLCEVNLMLGNIKDAHKYLEQALDWLGQLPNDVTLKFYIYSLAGDIALNENNIAEAGRYFSEAGDTTVIGPREMALHYSRLQRMYARMHDYGNAYRYLKRANHYENLIGNEQMRNQIAEIELRYRQDTTIMQQRLVISEKETQVRSLEMHIFIGVLSVLVLILFLIVYAMRKRRRRVMEEISLRQSLYAMRLANIRNRISPHFIFNILNRELKVNNPGVENLVKLMRTNLQLCDRYIVSLSEELNFVDTYVAAESPGLGDKFRYVKHISDGVDIDKIMIPSMMVQIFVENAVKHGLRGYDGEKHLDIYVRHSDDTLKITVENNGILSPHVDASSSTGTGMKVVTQTVNLLNERNERKIDIDIRRRVDGETVVYSVTIAIPDGFDFASMRN